MATRASVRVRYAPSPTGEPHVGNLRTALFNWLFARRHGGKFVIRVEDTDRERYVEGALETILESVRWLGLDWDEGPEVGGPYSPYFQSQRLEIYQEVSRELLDNGFAYLCYCSRERLEEMRLEQQRNKLPLHYDRRCRDLSSLERTRFESGGTVPVVRFKMPMAGDTNFVDLIRGEVTWQNEVLDDFILLKSDGFPTYHLANVVDDHRMQITHVLRAEEWLPSVPRHLRLYEALGYQPPLFGHLPMILGTDRAKLAKRHGATSVLEYRDGGYLPEGMVNFMALLGWSLDDKTDIMSRDVLIEHFSLERIGKSGAIFDENKLLWMNGVYIRQLSPHQLADRLLPFIDQELKTGSTTVDQEYLRRIIPLIQQRLKTLEEGPNQMAYFFKDDIDYENRGLIQKGMDAEMTLCALRRALEDLEGLQFFDTSSLEEVLRSTAAGLGLTGSQLFGSLRMATTGRDASPPLFETMEVLGRERCLKRIWAAAKRLEGLA